MEVSLSIGVVGFGGNANDHDPQQIAAQGPVSDTRLVHVHGVSNHDKRSIWNLILPARKLVEIRQVGVKVEVGRVSGVVDRNWVRSESGCV
jgi:hypothetical protein